MFIGSTCLSARYIGGHMGSPVSASMPFSVHFTSWGMLVPGAAVACSSTGVRERPRLPAGPSKLPEE